jgi:hypothetical protein
VARAELAGIHEDVGAEPVEVPNRGVGEAPDEHQRLFYQTVLGFAAES